MTHKSDELFNCFKNSDPLKQIEALNVISEKLVRQIAVATGNGACQIIEQEERE